MNQIPVKNASIVPLATDTCIGRLLVQDGRLAGDHTERVLSLQRERNIRFGEAATMLGLVTEEDVCKALARQFRFPYLRPGEGGFSPGLHAAYQPFDPSIAALRAVRNELNMRWFGTGHKSLAVAAVDADASSMLTANLGVLFSQLGKNTLIVDANLRQSKLHAVFNLSGRTGLSDLLADRGTEHCLIEIEAFPKLSVLPAGTPAPNPDDLLCRPELARLNQRLGERFDVILYNLSPGPMASDACSVAAVAGAIVLAAVRDQTRRQVIVNARDAAARHGAVVVGSILLDA